MSSSYPGGLDSITTTKTGSDSLTGHAALHDLTGDAVNKIEAELGINPKGTYSTVASRLSALQVFTPLTVTGDGTTDDSVTINSQLASFGVGTAFLGKYSIGLSNPIFIPNGCTLNGVGAMQGGTTLVATASFPHTTVNGAQTTPSSAATSFTLTVASTNGFPLGSGGVTPPGNVGVLSINGITVFYTGTTSTTFTGCRIQDCDKSVTLANSTAVGTFMVWLNAPGETDCGFGTRIQNVGMDCSGIAGISGIHSCHIQEGGGWSNIRITKFKNFGVRIDSYPAVAGDQQAVNWSAEKMWMIFSSTAEANAIGIDVMQSYSGTHTTLLDTVRGVQDASIVVQGSSLVVGKAGLRVNAASGTYRDIHLEDMNDGILIGDKYATAAIVENVGIGNNWGTGSGLRMGNISGNACVARKIFKSDPTTVPNRKIVTDDLNGFTSTNTQIDYQLFDDGTYSVNNGARVGLSTARPAASKLTKGALWLSTDSQRFSISDGARWYPLLTNPGIALVQDNCAAGARDNSAAITLTVTFTAATTVGNLLLLATGASSNQYLSSVTDSRGNSWFADAPDSAATQGFTANIASCKVTIAHQVGDTLTVTFIGSASYAAGIVSEWSGVKTTSWFDVKKQNAGSTGVGSTTASPTRTQADELIFGVEAYVNAATQTAGTGYTALTTKSSGAGLRKITPVYAVVSSVGTDPVTWGTDVSNWEAIMATYKAASSTS